MNISESAVIYSVTSVSVLPQDTDGSNGTFLIRAEGEVISSGWGNPRLLPYTFVHPPEDGIWDFDFVADAPDGISRPILTPIEVEYLMEGVSAGLTGVRVHAATNSIEAVIQ